MASISKDELAILNVVMRQLGGAQAAAQTVGAHLAQKYHLGPEDRIDDATGKIVRAPAAPRPPAPVPEADRGE